MFLDYLCFKKRTSLVRYNMENLSNIKKNRTYKIVGYSDNLPIKIVRRLCDLGLTEGESVALGGRSLLKKAMLIKVRGYLLSLKSDIARGVFVQ